MEVTLHPSNQKLVDELIASGRFSSADEAINCALAVFQIYERQQDDWFNSLTEKDLQALRRKLDKGHADIRAGRVYTREEACAFLTEQYQKQLQQ